MSFRFQQGERPLAGYTIQRGVGRGGFGEVYYATSDGGKEVALKYLRENPQVELRGVTHCLNLKSPHLVALHDVKQSDSGDWWVLMEYVSGPSLRDLMNSEPAGLGTQKAAYFLREIGKGLAYLHDRGIVHRDLKPGNIFYEDGYVKIGDYGLAKMMSASQHSGQTMSVGTVHYMAPEVGSGNYDRTIDIYALGVVLYEMLLGKVPFAGATMGEVLMKHLTAQPAVDELPAPFPHVIRKALAKDPKDRYQTVNEMIHDVFVEANIDQSVASFEHASLTTLAAGAARDLNATVAARPRVGAYAGAPAGHGAGAGVSVAGVRLQVFPGLGDGSSNVGQAVDPPPIHPERGGALNRFQNRIQRGVGRVADRIDRTSLAQQIADAAGQPRARPEQVIAALLIAIAGGVAFSASSHAGVSRWQLGFAGAVAVAAMVQGVVLGCWLSYERLRLQSTWLPKLLIVAIACIGLAPASAIAGRAFHGMDAQRWPIALMLTLAVCDWVDRFYAGRRGEFSLGKAFKAGLFTLIAGGIFADASLPFAALGVAASMAVQAFARVWPVAATDGLDAQQPPGGLRTPASNAVEPRPAAYIEHRTPDAGVRGAPRATHDEPAPLRAATASASAWPQRSSAVRAMWLVLCIPLHVGAIVSFIAAGTVAASDREMAIWCMSGASGMGAALFALIQSALTVRRSWWRGFYRPMIFIGGLSMAACGGIGAGLIAQSEPAMLPWIAAILTGAAMSLCVWFIPSSPQPPAPRTEEEREERRRRLGARLFVGGLIGLGLVGSLAAVMASMNDLDDLLPIAVVPSGVLSIGLIVAGATMGGAEALGRKRRKNRGAKGENGKLTLPLRRVFDVTPSKPLDDLLERNLAVMGFRLNHRANLLWVFGRGAWSAQFWQSNIRQWQTQLSIAASDLEDGAYRLTCYLDLERQFSDPSRRQLETLAEELSHLQEALGGREAPSAASHASAS